MGLTGDARGNLYLSSDWINHLIIKIEAPLGSTAIEEFSSVVPSHFILGQNYPNPFNNSTTINFGLPTSAQVRLSVYNLAGQEVAELVRGQYRAGSYALSWNGRDRDDRPLASGVYLYRMEAGGRTKVRKLLLLQ